MLKKLFVVFVASMGLSVEASFGQSSEKIETDRPGKAQTPYVVPKKSFQVETGFEWMKQDENELEFQHPEMVIKYGILKHLEFRTRILSLTDRMKQPSGSMSGIAPVEFGLKALITEARGLLPHTSFTASFGVPKLATKEYKADKVYPKLRLNLENELSEKVYLEYNIASEWDGFDNDPAWMVAVSPHVELGEKWQLFGEFFTEMQRGKKPEVSVDTGLIYWISKDVMLDLNAGLGISKAAPTAFADFGFSFRLK